MRGRKQYLLSVFPIASASMNTSLNKKPRTEARVLKGMEVGYEIQPSMRFRRRDLINRATSLAVAGDFDFFRTAMLARTLITLSTLALIII